jgi:WD40 repeat protein
MIQRSAETLCASLHSAEVTEAPRESQDSLVRTGAAMKGVLTTRLSWVVAIAAGLLSGTYYLVKLRQECGSAPLVACAKQAFSLDEQATTPERGAGAAEDVRKAAETARRIAEEKRRIAEERELVFWTTVKDAKSIVLLQTYLDRYPNGHFAALARALIEHLEKEKAASDAAARQQEQAVAAEDALKLAAARQQEEQRKLEAAKQADELARAHKKLREATEATERAKAAEQAALRSAEQAKKEVEQAKAARQQVIRDADQRAKAVSAKTPAVTPAQTDAKGPASKETAMRSEPSKPGHAIRVELGKARAFRSVAISKDGSLIAVAGDDHYVRLLSTTDLKLVRTLKGHRERVYAVAFSPEGSLLASAGWDGTIKLWTLATGEVENFTSGADKFYSVAFDPKVPLKYVLAGDGEGFVHIWDLQKKARVGKPEDHDGPVRAISFYPDTSGTYVSMGADGKLFARSWKTGTKGFEAHVGGGFFAVYSADGATVLTAGGDKKLKLWQPSEFKLLKSFEGHSKYVLTAALAADGRTMASGGGDGVVLLWDIDTGKIVQKLAGHETDVESVAFYRDGTRVVSVSEDKTLRVWDRSTGDQLAVAVGFTDGEYLAYSRGGKYTASDGGHVHLKILENGTEYDADKERRRRLFSPSGLAISSRN